MPLAPRGPSSSFPPPPQRSCAARRSRGLLSPPALSFLPLSHPRAAASPRETVAGSDGATGLRCGANCVPRRCSAPAVAPRERAPLVAAGADAPLPALHALVVSRLMLCVGVTTTRCPAPPARPTVHRPRGSIFFSIRPLTGLLFLSPSHAPPPRVLDTVNLLSAVSLLCDLEAIQQARVNLTLDLFFSHFSLINLHGYYLAAFFQRLLPCCIFFLPAIPPAPFGWILRLLQCPRFWSYAMMNTPFTCC